MVAAAALIAWGKGHAAMTEYALLLGKLVADLGFVLGGVWDLAQEFAATGAEGLRELWRGGLSSLGDVLGHAGESLGYAIDDLTDAIRTRGQ